MKLTFGPKNRYRQRKVTEREVKAIREARLRMKLANDRVHTQGYNATPSLHMIVSPWFKDEQGIMTRTVRAAN